MTASWSARSVLVTGASGFLGSWLVHRLLAEGARVVALMRDWDASSQLVRSGDVERIYRVNGRLEDYPTLDRVISEHNVDSVFHLGAQTIVGTALRSPLATFESNVRGTYNLLEACRVHQDLVQRVVVASSDKAYGEAEQLPYREETPLRGRYPYDVSKSCCDLLAQSYAQTYSLAVTIARCGNIYGGGDLNWSRIVPGTIRSLLEGERPILRGDGRSVRDYVFVSDVVEAYLLLGEQAGREGVRGEAFNLSPERRVDTLTLARLIGRLLGREDLEPVVLNQARSELREQVLDSTRARERLGWRPEYSLEDGLRESIAWYRDFLELVVPRERG